MRNLILIGIMASLFLSCKNSEPGVPANQAALDSLNKKYQLNLITVPAGFHINVYAEVPNARSMCLGAKGTLFVGNRNENNVYAVVDEDKDGMADKVYTIAKDLKMPNGVAFKDGSLYVAEVSRILRFDDIENHLGDPPAYKVVTDSYPDKTHHGWKFIAFGPDGKLYVPVGAPCNVCDEEDSIFASITRMDPDGSNREIFAHGVRNSVGFDWHPGTKELWFTDNGRDNMGDDVPFCELNRAPEKGMHFGFPYIHQGNVPDPEFGKGHDSSEFTPPALKVGPHAAPLGMRFYTGSMFPAKYQKQIFIAERGSWNRTKPYGYQVKVAFLEGNNVVRYENFATGWLTPDDQKIGRPVDVQQLPDGSLLISDDTQGVIYRVTYEGAK